MTAREKGARSRALSAIFPLLAGQGRLAVVAARLPPGVPLAWFFRIALNDIPRSALMQGGSASAMRGFRKSLQLEK